MATIPAKPLVKRPTVFAISPSLFSQSLLFIPPTPCPGQEPSGWDGPKLFGPCPLRWSYRARWLKRKGRIVGSLSTNQPTNHPTNKRNQPNQPNPTNPPNQPTNQPTQPTQPLLIKKMSIKITNQLYQYPATVAFWQFFNRQQLPKIQ